MSSVRQVAILGSTGSIGIQALEVIAAHPDKFRIVAISAGGANVQLLLEQARKFSVEVIGVKDNGDAVRKAAGDIQVIDGLNASTEIAAIPCDIVLNAITGSIGLGPTLAALAAGNKVALANKESLVAGGDLVMAHGKDRIIPVDSEHSALYQCFLAGKQGEIKQAVITASGGAFRDRDDLASVTLLEALTHPTWSMGPLVTINSATLVNKGLEIIEAHHLFGLAYSQIHAVIHPQSVVHSMVEYIDGASIAQVSPPNMKSPIAYALAGAERISQVAAPIDWTRSHTWTFEPIDEIRFPSIALARECGENGGGMPAVFNASNEVAVEAFMKSQIPFTSIIDIVAKSAARLSSSARTVIRDISDVSAVEEDARQVARELIKGSSK